MNNAVKFRKDWRPFAPSFLEEARTSLFESYHTTPFYDAYLSGQAGEEGSYCCRGACAW
jgi:predicted NodU family carbamoyl transferase